MAELDQDLVSTSGSDMEEPSSQIANDKETALAAARAASREAMNALSGHSGQNKEWNEDHAVKVVDQAEDDPMINDAEGQRVSKVLEAMLVQTHATTRWANTQRVNTKARFSTQQWLDENETEWKSLDHLCRSRPWATNKDKEFPYPFRQATIDMHEAGEVDWIGDRPGMTLESIEDATTRRKDEGLSKVLLHLRPSQEHPPDFRLILFNPEFGDANSFSIDEWAAYAPGGQMDVWAVCWQGWTDFDTMIDELLRNLLCFGDSTSTVWYGHSAGALVAYECMKRLESTQTPNFPVALAVSGCPAPHLLGDGARLPHLGHDWLKHQRYLHSFDHLSVDKVRLLEKDFGMLLDHPEIDRVRSGWVNHGLPPPSAVGVAHGFNVKERFDKQPRPNEQQRMAVIEDQKLLGTYAFRHSEAERKIGAPILAFSSDEDSLVEPSSVAAWQLYTDDEFQHVELEDDEDGEMLAELGHGFARCPPRTVIDRLVEWSQRHKIFKMELMWRPELLPDIGPTDGPLPETIKHLVVGAGISGITFCRSLCEQGSDELVVVDRCEKGIGGIWQFYANRFSRVNTSEVGYRLTSFTKRPNEDHTPTHDIVRDIYSLASKHAKDKIRLGWSVEQCEKQADGKFLVTFRHASDKSIPPRKILCTTVNFCINRRIGKRRDLTFKGEEKFRGDSVYGYANEVVPLKFWGKRVIVVGAGAFAFENMRTALEHGAKHVTILGRRAGTTCPKWIDMIAFLRPQDEYHHVGSKVGHVISFQAWRQCYEDAELPTPECWDEGLLKPHNHTVSVSDLAFIAGYHGMASLLVGEIGSFRDDGQGVVLKDGRKLDVDIVIKATGFHLVDTIPEITGLKTMHSNGFLDFNMAYSAEMLLDGGQFGSSTKGREESSHLAASDEQMAAVFSNKHKLPQDIQKLFIPRGNPFGSGYCGVAMAQNDFIAYLMENPEMQKQVLELSGQPNLSIRECWASQIGFSSYASWIKACSRIWLRQTSIAH